MKALRIIAALVCLLIFVPPIWATHLAILYGFAPTWVYASLVGLALVGLVVIAALIYRAISGAPRLGEKE